MSPTRPTETKEQAFLRSALAETGVLGDMEAVLAWFAAHDREKRFTVTRVPLSAMPEWEFLDAPLRLAHRSGRFFSIGGLRVDTDFGPVPSWDQPIAASTTGHDDSFIDASQARQLPTSKRPGGSPA